MRERVPQIIRLSAAINFKWFHFNSALLRQVRDTEMRRRKRPSFFYRNVAWNNVFSAKIFAISTVAFGGAMVQSSNVFPASNNIFPIIKSISARKRRIFANYLYRIIRKCLHASSQLVIADFQRKLTTFCLLRVKLPKSIQRTEPPFYWTWALIVYFGNTAAYFLR